MFARCQGTFAVLNYPLKEIVVGYSTGCYCTFFHGIFASLNQIIRIYDDIRLCVHLAAVFFF